MNGIDRKYYLRRESAERDMAERASDPAIANIHRQFADHYLNLCVASTPQPVLRQTAD